MIYTNSELEYLQTCFGRGPKDAKENPINIFCGNCGSENVTRDAMVEWDCEHQMWTLSNVFDQGDCQDCGAENCLQEKPIRE